VTRWISIVADLAQISRTFVVVVVVVVLFENFFKEILGVSIFHCNLVFMRKAIQLLCTTTFLADLTQIIHAHVMMTSNLLSPSRINS